MRELTRIQHLRLNPKDSEQDLGVSLVVDRAAKPGSCGIVAFPSFHHGCRSGTWDLPTTLYAEAETWGVLFGACPT